MPTAVVDPRKAPTSEQSVSVLAPLPSWGQIGGQPRGIPVDREYVPELRWPTSVRDTFLRMETDTQLSGLMRGTTLPIRRYVWGIDPNGAPPKMVAAVMRDFNLPLIDDAWAAFQNPEQKTVAVGRSKHRFSFDKHLADVMEAPKMGHHFFEQVGEIADDGAAWGAPSALFWHPQKLAPIAAWTIGQIFAATNGDLISIRQSFGLNSPELLAETLVPYVFDKRPGEWIGRSMYRSCYREWLLKDRLLRVDLVNHENAGGKLIPIAPQDATPTEIIALSAMSQQFRVEGGGAVPAGTGLQFIRASGSDVIGSINRHDEAMAREFLMMFMALGTKSSGGNRALAGSFIDWFSISQETIAKWACDTFNEDVLEDYVDWNYGTDEEYVPRLVFRRPEAASPLDVLSQAVQAKPGDPGALAVQDPNAGDNPIAATRRGGDPGAVHVSDEVREAILDAHAGYLRYAKPQSLAAFNVVRQRSRQRHQQQQQAAEAYRAAWSEALAIRRAEDAAGTPIDELAPLDSALTHALRRGGITTIERLTQCRENDIAAIPNVGATRLSDIRHRLATRGLGFVAETRNGVPVPSRPLRRDPTAVEQQAQVDFAKIDQTWQAQVGSLVSRWQAVRAQQITELVAAITDAGGDLTKLAQVEAIAAGGDLIAAQLKTMAHLGAAEAVGEAVRQGASASAPEIATLETELAARASALERLLASALSQAAANKAVQLSGGALAPADVATQVGTYLDGLSNAYLSDQFGGALSAAQNAGRLAAMEHNGASAYYASELLDTNTCDPCAGVDGTEYASADEAAADYPTGGYFDCDGGPRCRGTVIAVYDEAAPSAGAGVLGG